MKYPNPIVRLCSVVRLVSGEKTKDIFKYMPIALVNAYEHVYYMREGFKVRPLDQSLESEFPSI